jgi:hypothetical protein
MFTPGQIALRFKLRKRCGLKPRVRVGAVQILRVEDLGALGVIAEVRSADRDRRFAVEKIEQETEFLNVKELIPLSWLENLRWAGMPSVARERGTARGKSAAH